VLPCSFNEGCEALGIQVPHPAQVTRQMPIDDEIAEHRLVKGRIAEIGSVAKTQEEVDERRG
jgi:hypothetical protein